MRAGSQTSERPNHASVFEATFFDQRMGLYGHIVVENRVEQNAAGLESATLAKFVFPRSCTPVESCSLPAVTSGSMSTVSGNCMSHPLP